jgi:hypothetical protein
MKTAGQKQGSAGVGGRRWAAVVLVGGCLLRHDMATRRHHKLVVFGMPCTNAIPYQIPTTHSTLPQTMPTPPGPIRRAWYEWKMLRFPWRKRWLVGFDLEGNTFWEFKDALHALRNRRIAKYHRSTHYGDVNVSRASSPHDTHRLLSMTATTNTHSRLDAMAPPHAPRPPNHCRTAARPAPPRNNKAARRPRRPALGREALCPRRPRQAAAHPGPRVARPQRRPCSEQCPARQRQDRSDRDGGAAYATAQEAKGQEGSKGLAVEQDEPGSQSR